MRDLLCSVPCHFFLAAYSSFDSNIGILVGTLITIVSVICLLALIVCLAMMCKRFSSHKAGMAHFIHSDYVTCTFA